MAISLAVEAPSRRLPEFQVSRIPSPTGTVNQLETLELQGVFRAPPNLAGTPVE